tara:strand:+ start:118 stop:474 length:357 start_codon:yes stop_codon:yes gene_type:complete
MVRKTTEKSTELDSNQIITTSKGKKLSVKEIENSTRIYKSATPKHTADWYIKWVASILILTSMSFRGQEEFATYDLLFSTAGVSLWLVVSLIWNDRALIMVNGVGLMLLAKNIVQTFL